MRNNLIAISDGPVRSQEVATLKPGLEVPVSVEITDLKIKSGEYKPFIFEVEMVYLADKYKYGLKRVSVTKTDGDLQALDLRAVPIRKLFETARTMGLNIGLLNGSMYDSNNLPALKDGDRGVLLRNVAVCAALARLFSQDQAKVVAQDFEVAERTASRWISEAKDKGLLD